LRGGFFAGLAICLAIALPWHLAMFHLYGRAFVQEYLGLHVLTRATQQIEGHITPWWFYLKVLLVAAPPFVLLYPAAVAQALRRNSKLRAFAVFALVELIFFTLVQTRLPQYIVPMYPALAVVTAVWLGERIRALHAGSRSAAWRKVVIAAAITIGAVLATAHARSSLHSANAAGVPASDSKDSTALLRNRPQPILGNQLTAGPLLVWHQGRVMSMPSIVFYARRPVEQVELLPLAAEPAADRYTFDPQPSAEAITAQPRLILLDRTLAAQIPAQFNYMPIATQGTMELGTIARRQLTTSN
jgi:4-amino-4-deoxy-L-arabinose transferase-like glycosyltransferase